MDSESQVSGRSADVEREPDIDYLEILGNTPAGFEIIGKLEVEEFTNNSGSRNHSPSLLQDYIEMEFPPPEDNNAVVDVENTMNKTIEGKEKKINEPELDVDLISEMDDDAVSIATVDEALILSSSDEEEISESDANRNRTHSTIEKKEQETGDEAAAAEAATSTAATGTGTDQCQPSAAPVNKKDDNKDKEKDNKSLDNSQYKSNLDCILQDARFFLMKSINAKNVELSKSKGVWSTQPTNTARLNEAFKTTKNVILIFSVNGSGKYSGFARLAAAAESGHVGTDKDKDSKVEVEWVLSEGSKQLVTVGQLFEIDWISKKEMDFNEANYLYNPWNEGKPVKIGRDGQEIQPDVASKLCRLFNKDRTTDWESVLKKSEDSAKRIGDRGLGGKVVAPLSETFKSATRGRVSSGGGFGDHHFRGQGYGGGRDDPERSFFEYGRGTRRSFTPDDYDDREERARKRARSRDYYRPDWRDSDSGRSSQRITSQVGSISYLHLSRHQPPPVAPFLYPPPPPFDMFPPPPLRRYYDGPPLPPLPSELTMRSEVVQLYNSQKEKGQSSVFDRIRKRSSSASTSDRDRERQDKDPDRGAKRKKYDRR